MRISIKLIIIAIIVLVNYCVPAGIVHAGLLVKQPSMLGLTNGLVGYWTFDGPDFNSAGLALDKSGNGNNGTLTNGPTKTIGKIGQGLNFDGSTTQSVDITGFSSTAQTYTFSFWTKRSSNATGQNYVFDSASGRLVISFGTSCTGNNLCYYDGAWHALGVVSTNAWHHIALVLNSTASTATGYVDGTVLGTDTYTGTNIGGATRIGNHNNVNTAGFEGQLDDFRIYNRALSAQEIQRLYNMGK